jgi:hypothetical protein
MISSTFPWNSSNRRSSSSEYSAAVARQAFTTGPHPLLAAVDAEFGQGDRLPDVIDALTSSLTGHLGHEERDGLPLIGVALTSSEWRGVGRKIATKNGLSAGSEMFAWMLDGADRDHGKAALAQLPPPVRLLYRAVWKPRFEKTHRW